MFSQGLGWIKGTTACLYLKEGSQPRFYHACQVPYALWDKVAKEIDRQVELGILEAVKFSPWATPVVPILNKDGSIRLCGDYKVTVNRETVTETYPLLRVEDLLASLSGDTMFLKFNLTHAYQRVVLDDEAKQLTTINTHKGLYHCKQTPFGVALAPCSNGSWKTYSKVFQGCMFDDILVTGRSIPDHLRNLEVAHSCLEEAGVKLKHDKCSFLLTAMEFLGHHISAKGI